MAEHSDQTSVTNELQSELQDLLCLAIVGDHVRWVVVGDGAPELADWLIDATDAWRAWADQLAKHLVGLGVAPDARVRSLAKDIPWNWVPEGWLSLDEARRLVADRLRRLAEWARVRQSQVTDPEIVRLLGVVCTGLETQVADLPAGKRP
jgi:starvation-inducible DNA-binding protein